MNAVDQIKWAMSLREPQYEALKCFNNISSIIDFKNSTKEEAEKVASENCQEPHKIVVDKEPKFDFSKYYQNSEYYNGSITIDNKTMKYSGKLIKQFLKAQGI